MNAADIEKIIARHLLQKGSLDPFLATADRSEATQDFLDMLCMEKRRRVMIDLRPLATASPAEILKAFETFGVYETTFYIQELLAGSHELADILPIYMAARKMGYPDESWDQVHVKSQQAGSLLIKNPQSEIYQGHRSRMEAAITDLLEGKITPENLPYTHDRMYLNTILTSHAGAVGELEIQSSSSLRLINYSLDQSDQYSDMTVEQKLRCAGLLALACMILPGSNTYSDDVTKKPLLQQLLRAQEEHTVLITELDKELIKSSGHADYLVYAQDLRKRVGGYTHAFEDLIARVARKKDEGIELFIQPVQLALRIYSHDLARKIATVLQENIAISHHRSSVVSIGKPSPP